MPLEPFSRRLLLQAAGAAFGTLAGSTVLPGFASAVASAGAFRPMEGNLLAWVLLYPEQGAEIRLAHFDRDGHLLGRAPVVRLGEETLGTNGGVVSAWGQMRRACARAQTLSIIVAAHSWSVRPEHCGLQPRRIVHQPSGRSIGFGVWADIT